MVEWYGLSYLMCLPKNTIFVRSKPWVFFLSRPQPFVMLSSVVSIGVLNNASQVQISVYAQFMNSSKQNHNIKNSTNQWRYAPVRMVVEVVQIWLWALGCRGVLYFPQESRSCLPNMIVLRGHLAESEASIDLRLELVQHKKELVIYFFALASWFTT